VSVGFLAREVTPSAAGQFIFSTGARAQARKLVGGWARRARAKIKVDK